MGDGVLAGLVLADTQAISEADAKSEDDFFVRAVCVHWLHWLRVATVVATGVGRGAVSVRGSIDSVAPLSAHLA